MANVQLTHKLRNPKSYNDWMNIWTAHTDKDENNSVTYTIYPSSNWKIPISQLTTNVVTEDDNNKQSIQSGDASLPLGVTISVTQITDTNDTHNVTSPKSIGSNVLTKTDNNGNLVAGPIINNNGNETKFLNEKGEWATDHTYVLSLMLGYKMNDDDSRTFNGYQFYDVKNDTYKRFFLEKGENINVIPTIHATQSPSTSSGEQSGQSEQIGGFRFEIINKSIGSDKLADNLDLSDKLIDNSISGDKLVDNSVSGSKLNTKLLGVLINTDKPVSANSASLAEELKRTDYKLNHNDQEPNWWIDSNWDWEHLGIWVEI